MPGHSSNYTHYGGTYKKPRNIWFNPQQYAIETVPANECPRIGPWHMVPKPYTYRIVDRLASAKEVKHDKPTATNHCRGRKVTEEELFSLVNRLSESKGSKNSSDGEMESGSSQGSGEQMNRRTGSGRSCIWHQRPHMVYGNRSVDRIELGDIVKRMTKPTVSSRGGVDLAEKRFNYIMPPKQKTFIEIPGLETRFKGRSVDKGELDTIVERLTRRTQATKSRFALDPHSWYDHSGWAQRHRTKTAAEMKAH